MGCVQTGASTPNRGGGSQAQTEALGGWQEGDHRRHEETMGAEKGRSREDSEDRNKETGKEGSQGTKTGRGADCLSVDAGGRGRMPARSRQTPVRAQKASLVVRSEERFVWEEGIS